MLARQQLITAEKRDGVKAQRPKREDKQSQGDRQRVCRLVKGEMTIVPAARPLHFRGKVGRLKIVRYRDHRQQNR